MTFLAKGNFSIRGVSTSKTGGNIMETIHTGFGTGTEGNVKFQATVLTSIETIVRNRLDPNYDLASILILDDQPTIGESSPLSLFIVPDNITQTQTPSSTLLQSFLLKEASVVEGSETEITDANTVKLMEYISAQAFYTIQKASKVITEGITESDFSENFENGRFSTSIENSVFSLYITIQ